MTEGGYRRVLPPEGKVIEMLSVHFFEIQGNDADSNPSGSFSVIEAKAYAEATLGAPRKNPKIRQYLQNDRKVKLVQERRSKRN